MREDFYSNDGTITARVEGYNDENGKTLYRVFYNGDRYGALEEHTPTLYEWARHLHGNAPSGTPYAYFRATKNGKRVIITV